ncbi:MAG: DUF6527 family protein [Acidithiobacillus ferriphilus]
MGVKLKHSDGLVSFMCPGCNSSHTISIAYDEVFPKRPLWGWNKSDTSPTFTPSINSRVGPFPDGSFRICHSFVKDGHIQYLGDCTHAMAGKTAEIPDFPFEVWE